MTWPPTIDKKNKQTKIAHTAALSAADSVSYDDDDDFRKTDGQFLHARWWLYLQ